MSETEKTGLVGTILKFVGFPSKRGRRKEQERWKTFMKGLGWLSLVKGGKALDAAERYAVASVNEKEADAEIKKNQAAELAAQAVTERRKSTKAVFDLIEGTGVGDEVAKQLKLAALFKENPELLQAVDEFNTYVDDLGREKGLSVSFPQIESDEEDVVEEA